jgi:biotin-(acetyl-CoA carboxylase) ligase
MCSESVLPPLLRASAVGADEDPFTAACRLAEAGEGPGTVTWSRRADRLDCAIVLGTQARRPAAFVAAYVVMVAVGDALGAIMPPVVAVTYRWPDRIEVNGTVAGGLRMAADRSAAPGEVPRWVAAGLTVAVTADQRREARGRSHTTLHGEGGGGDVPGLLESFGRHLLHWVKRFEQDGLDPVLAAWRARCSDRPEAMTVLFKGQSVSGRLVGIAPNGALDIASGGRTRRLGLDQALTAPTWSLDSPASQGRK